MKFQANSKGQISYLSHVTLWFQKAGSHIFIVADAWDTQSSQTFT